MLQNRKLQRDNFEEVHSLAPDGGIENVANIPIFHELCTFIVIDLSLLAAHTHRCYLLNKAADLLKCSWKSNR